MNGSGKRRAMLFGAAVVLGAGLIATSASAAAYMEITGVSGDSADQQHKGWIEIESFRFDAGSRGNMASTGAGAGRGEMHEITITKRTDRSSPLLMQAAARGQHFRSAVIEEETSDGRLMRIDLDDVMVTAVHTSASGGMPSESVELQFATSTTSYSMMRRSAPMMNRTMQEMGH